MHICNTFFRAVINMFIRVIFPNIITYLDTTFKKQQNDINFKTKNWYNVNRN